jgi:hypothetical protein
MYGTCIGVKNMVEPIVYYPKPMGARNTIHPETEEDRKRLIEEIQQRGGIVVNG